MSASVAGGQQPGIFKGGNIKYNKWLKVCENTTGPVIRAVDVVEQSKTTIKDFTKENFVVIGLNSKNKILYKEVVSIGILNSSLIHPREVFKKAVVNSCNAIIIAHNHPSGDPTPSEEDKRITKQLQEAGNILGIKLLDHVIIGSGGHYSFDENELPG